MVVDLKNKKAIVLGVRDEDSIAFSIAKCLVESGCSVICGYQERNLESVNLLKEKLKVNGIDIKFEKFDVVDDLVFDGFYEKVKLEFGKVDFIVHSIAFAKKEDLKGRLVDVDKRGFEVAMDVSAYSLIKVVKKFEDIVNENGSVIAMTYEGARKVVKNYNIMGVAKAALEAEIKYLASELLFRVNGISSGVVETKAAKAIKGYIDIVADSISKSPMKRLVERKEVADVALFLCSDLSSGVTGEIINVDCGANL